MGVFINLHIIPNRIDPEDWRAVYRETLTLIHAFPFLSRVRGEDGFPYAARTTETKDLADGCTGWYVDGDMRNGSNMESYQLVEDIQNYQQRENGEDNGYDILLDGLYDLEVGHPQCSINIWGNKTQGEPAHIFLLAIACLICDRFPHAAFVDGDISAGQCYQATQWANQFLTSPIGMPVTADIERLLPRLKSAGLTEQQRLEVFFELALARKDSDLGDCLKDSFSPQDISAYYREKLKPRHRTAGQLYLDGAALKEYLALELDFRQLCWLVMADPEGNRLTPEEFMRELLRRKLHVEEKETGDYTSFSRGSAQVDTVGSMLIRAFLMLHGGHNANVDAYIPLPDICEGFRAALGQDFDAEGLAESILGEGVEPGKESTQALLYDDPNSDFRKRIAQIQEQAQENAAYDIASYDDLMDFRRLKDGRYWGSRLQIHRALAWMLKRQWERCQLRAKTLALRSFP